MRVVLAVALPAGRRSGGRELLALAGMAGRARDSFVRALERETGHCRVIERCSAPVDRRMAACTSRAERTVVGVFVRVTIAAGCSGIMERRRRMARRALKRRVLAEQWERNEPM